MGEKDCLKFINSELYQNLSVIGTEQTCGFIFTLTMTGLIFWNILPIGKWKEEIQLIF